MLSYVLLQMFVMYLFWRNELAINVKNQNGGSTCVLKVQIRGEQFLGNILTTCYRH